MLKSILGSLLFILSFAYTTKAQTAAKSAAPLRTSITYSGTAIDATSKAKIFLARFTETRINGVVESLETTYYSPDGKEKIATRSVIFTKNRYAPNFVFHNLRTKGTETMTTSGNVAEVHYKKGGTETVLKKKLTVPAPMVADAGLVELVREKWTSLKAGKREPACIIVPSRQDFYHFTLYDKTTAADKKANRTTIYFESNYWLIRSLMEPIVMVFDNTTKQLVRFEGTTNLTNDSGDPFMKAIITYQYNK